MVKHERESKIEKLLLSLVKNDNNTQLRISIKIKMQKNLSMIQ